MPLTFRNPFYEVEHEPSVGLARVRRTTQPFLTLEDLRRAHVEVEAELHRLGAPRLLIDVRDGPAGRNDPAFEDGGRAARQGMTRGAARIAILVRTAAGALHARRLAREDGIPCAVCTDEADALRHLGGE